MDKLLIGEVSRKMPFDKHCEKATMHAISRQRLIPVLASYMLHNYIIVVGDSSNNGKFIKPLQWSAYQAAHLSIKAKSTFFNCF
jgi:sorbitol-specific phosphotransferase system component IIC